jgi:hypothetical protein
MNEVRPTICILQKTVRLPMPAGDDLHTANGLSLSYKGRCGSNERSHHESTDSMQVETE